MLELSKQELALISRSLITSIEKLKKSEEYLTYDNVKRLSKLDELNERVCKEFKNANWNPNTEIYDFMRYQCE